MIKVCPNPTCDAVWHNCKTEDKKCKNCGFTIKEIDTKTYTRKYKEFPMQFDYITENILWQEKKLEVLPLAQALSRLMSLYYLARLCKKKD